MNKQQINKFKALVDAASHVLIIQAENPDGDSLASSLALEELISALDKQVSMYCPVNMPRHLRHLKGWDRVVDELPKNFDLSIIVDTSASSLLLKVFTPEQKPKILKHPVIVIDHHATVENDLDFEHLEVLDKSSVATGESLFKISKQLGWDINLTTAEFLATSIMYDSMGLSSESTTAQTIRIVADLVEIGVSLAKLDALRRQTMVKGLDLTNYKGQLLQRIELIDDGRLAFLHIPFEEIEKYSDQYNPSMLVIEDMRLVDGVEIAVAVKTYPDGKLTAKLRANYSFDYADELAKSFGGGGHPYAAGFKVFDSTVEAIKVELIKAANDIRESRK